jgi:hypothetical protein
MATKDEGDLLVIILDAHLFYEDLQGGAQSGPENLLQQAGQSRGTERTPF